MSVPSSWTIWLSELIRDYTDAAAGTGGIPSTADVPRFIFDDGSQLTDPHLSFRASIGARKHERVLPMTVEILLVTQAAGDNATTEAAASAWMQAIRRRIQEKIDNVSTFGTWLAALSAETRRGWQIVAEPRLNAEPDIVYDSDSGRREQTETLRLSVLIETE